MTPLVHLFCGLAIYKVASGQDLQLDNVMLMLFAIAGAIVPDIDGLFGKKMKDHRYTVFHTPLFWLLIYSVSYILLKALGYLQLLTYLKVFAIGTLVHLILDFISARTSGIWVFYPFSRKAYSLFGLKPEMGNTSVLPSSSKEYKDFWRFYLRNRLLVFAEILAAATFLLVFLFYPQKNTLSNIQTTSINDVASKTIKALKEEDFQSLANLVHSKEGVRFSPYTNVNKQQIVLTKLGIQKGFADTNVYEWGFYDGSGKPINLTFKDYYKEFVYDQDYASATEVLYNTHMQRGNTTNNTSEFYPDSRIVEYFLPGTNPEYGGMDWRSLKLVFQKEGNDWKLVGIVHDEWTI